MQVQLAVTNNRLFGQVVIRTREAFRQGDICVTSLVSCKGSNRSSGVVLNSQYTIVRCSDIAIQIEVRVNDDITVSINRRIILLTLPHQRIDQRFL